MIILGSTGSIGCAALEIAKRFGKKVEALAAGRNIALLNKQILESAPAFVCIADEVDRAQLEPRGAKVFVGSEGICELLESAQSSLVINAIVGFAGLKPSLHTQKLGKTLALANKESLVSGGWLLDTSKILPIDSEHFGLWYLQSARVVKRLIITASGGAFRDAPLESIATQSKSSALNHPNWKMGAKITIDSASMMNKIFEILEAFWLFGCKDVEAFIERSSSVHALIEFVDGSTTAHFALPDMRLPIAYAIDAKKAAQSKILESMDLSQILNLTFAPIDSARYPLYTLKDRLLSAPKLGVIVNASNEVAIAHFLADRICFGAISEVVFDALEAFAGEIGESSENSEASAAKKSSDTSETKGANKTSALGDYDSIASLDAKVRAYCQEKMPLYAREV
ncbi:1-deoxy-D-xylulose-5-phosphate reductoisomerase [Helicobacter sp. CLO-3]|uniref:1-deoxy-D-xylulose-5-phosphate reductoisomerase n=1 Tax=unclassified Helicobacter TaxID=2593540 RepID=UPI00080536CC|nr:MULTISPECIES: 1-deoxy-D-xylulose-5-phosphate reductoisomerase [unclassified Helicobacter]OBV29909.1 1-deoxy-D-xylulose-5-phosphate reductoisomerase [Helicobacter sp. CLO-3]OHU81754.1 1-deoxy-D-xylulose-5-phosphate reductoisomerase [Helicobacter sp. CLO-3]